jgi:outer membrane protein assembly factor BamA
MSNAKQYPFSVSPVDGWRLRVGYAREIPGLGSELSLGKLFADARSYVRLPGGSALALRGGYGTTFGEPAFPRTFAVGGFPDGALHDIVRTNVAVLRGYPDDAFTGRSYVVANAELRLGFGRVQRGYRSLPVFLRHMHTTLFFDVGNAWNATFRASDLKTAVGGALGADVNLAHVLPLTAVVGVGHGFAAEGETRAYFRLGLAF